MEGGESGWTTRASQFSPRRTHEATRELLEYLITRGTVADLANADPEWLKVPPPDEYAFEWYSQFGDAGKVMRGRDELLQMVVELQRSSKAPAARALNAAAWFDEWVELPQPALGFRSPSQVLCMPVGLEAAKVILRALQEAVGRSPAAGPGVAKRIRGVFRVFGVALVSIAAIGLAARPAALAAEEVDASAAEPLEVVVLPARAHVLAMGFGSTEESLAWSIEASTNLDAAVREVTGARADLVIREMPEVSVNEQRVIDEFVSVVSLSGVAINDAPFLSIAGVRKSALDRTFGPSLAFLHDRTGADYALGTFACQPEQTKGVASLGATVGVTVLTGGALAPVVPTTMNYVTLFLADLRTGELRWFKVATGYEVSGLNFTDLRDPESARKVVTSLLKEYPDKRNPRSKPVAPGPSRMRRVSALEGEFNLQIPDDWRARNTVKRIVRATRDDNALNEMSVELRSHTWAFRYAEQKTTRDSAPEQLAAWFVEDLRKQEFDSLEIIDITEDTLANRPAFRVRYSYQMSGCLQAVRVEQVTVGTVIPKGLLLAGLRAPQLLYFEEALPVFEESVRTVAVRP
jgi:hypothetical protein